MNESVKKNKGNDGEKKNGKTFIYVLIGFALSPFAGFLFVEIFKVISGLFSFAQEYCFNDNFWMTAFYGILISAGLTCFIPSVMLIAVGILRLVTRKELGFVAILIGTMLAPANLYLAYFTYEWFTPHSHSAVYDNAEEMLFKFDKQISDRKGSEIVLNELGDFSFPGGGSLILSKTENGCYIAKTAHDCLRSELVWNSCKGEIEGTY